jgi:hypothetical protein
LFVSESSHSTIYLPSSYKFRYASTNPSNDEEKKKNITNLIYVAGALTGLGAIYSLVCYFISKKINRIVCSFKVEKVRKKKNKQ